MTPDGLIVYAFAEQMARARIARGVTQVWVAERMEISASYINCIERGRRSAPPSEWIARWGQVLDLSDEEMQVHSDVAKTARGAWRRWTKTLRLRAQQGARDAAYETIEALLAGAQGIDVVLQRDAISDEVRVARRHSRERLVIKHLDRPTVILRATYLPAKEAAM